MALVNVIAVAATIFGAAYAVQPAYGIGFSKDMTLKIKHQRTRLGRQRRYSVCFEVRADLARVAGSMFGGGCCSPAIAHQTLT
jgi:hypothetical protein